MDMSYKALIKRFFSQDDDQDPSENIKEFKIPQKWRDFMVSTYKKHADAVENPEDISKVTYRWRWTISRQIDPILMTIRLLHLEDASTINRLIDAYIMQGDIDIYGMEEEEETRLYNRMRKLFSRTLKTLYNCGLVEALELDRETVGSGKRTVTIWVSPFAKESDVEREKKLYLAMGGSFGTGKRKRMTEEEYDELMRERIELTKKRRADRFKKLNKIEFECTNCGIKVYVSKNDELQLLTYDSGKKCTCRKGRFKRVTIPKTKRRTTKRR